MKKQLFGWMTIVLMVFACVGFVACGDKDDEEGGGDAIPSGLVGSWYKDSGAVKYSMTFTFKADGTGTGYSSHNNIYSEDAFSFTYTVKGSTITCKGIRAHVDEDNDDTSNITLKFDYRGSTLTLTDAPQKLWIGAVFSKD